MFNVIEYNDIGSTGRGSIAIPLEPPAAQQSLEVGPNSVQSKPFGATTCIVKLSSDEDCLFAIGVDPDATSSARKLKAGVEQTISVLIGGGFKVAVAASQSGSVSGMDSLESLLKLVTSPAEVKQQVDMLAAAAAKLEAATEAAREAAGAFEMSGRLGQWEDSLRQREQAVAAKEADLASRFTRLRALG